MTGAALLLALAAAVVHAAWNLLLAREEDPRAATSAALAVGMLALAPFSLAFWDVGAQAVPYAAGSAALELAYLALLALAYAKYELSAVYPTARGSAPVFALLVSVLFLGGAARPLGILVVAAGLVLVHGGSTRAVGIGLAIGATIAGYTLLDSRGLEHAAPVPYLLLTLGPPALVYPLIARPRFTWAAAVAGLGMVGGYLLVLAALEAGTREDVAAVAAVREVSIVIAVAFGALVLRERVTRRRVLGAAVVVAGLALIGA
jgi:drug/metabolite transporter (DMT)-like permease